MKRLLAILILALVAVPCLAGTVACTSGLVSAGYCRSTSDTLIYLPITTSQLTTLVPALAHAVGWTPTVLCTEALVASGGCTAPQIGQQVTNPETQAQAAARALRAGIIGFILSAQRQQIVETKDAEKAAGVAAVTDPDVGN